MIEKFDILHTSYQVEKKIFSFNFHYFIIEDILMTMKNSNEELNDLQRQLLLTIEVTFASILSISII